MASALPLRVHFTCVPADRVADAAHAFRVECGILGDNKRMLSERAVARQRRMTIRRFASSADADRHDMEFRQQIPAADRVLQVWQLSQEQWQVAGRPPYEPGLCRSVASVRRR